MNDKLKHEWDLAHQAIKKAIRASVEDADERNSQDAIVPDWIEHICEHCQARLWFDLKLTADKK